MSISQLLPAHWLCIASVAAWHAHAAGGGIKAEHVACPHAAAPAAAASGGAGSCPGLASTWGPAARSFVSGPERKRRPSRRPTGEPLHALQLSSVVVGQCVYHMATPSKLVLSRVHERRASLCHNAMHFSLSIGLKCRLLRAAQLPNLSSTVCCQTTQHTLDKIKHGMHSCCGHFPGGFI